MHQVNTKGSCFEKAVPNERCAHLGGQRRDGDHGRRHRRPYDDVWRWFPRATSSRQGQRDRYGEDGDGGDVRSVRDSLPYPHRLRRQHPAHQVSGRLLLRSARLVRDGSRTCDHHNVHSGGWPGGHYYLRRPTPVNARGHSVVYELDRLLHQPGRRPGRRSMAGKPSYLS